LSQQLARGSTPRVPAKRFFFVRDVTEKASRAKVQKSTDHSKTLLPNRRWTLTSLSWRTTPDIRITSPSTWESVHVSTLPHDAY
jgi:hypothetical protein